MSDWALITGASAGIGAELTRIFAANRFNLALLARDETRLRRMADELKGAHDIETKVVACDLAVRGAAATVFDRLRDTPISILVNNAGFGRYGTFAETDLQVHVDMMQVNMRALVELTHFFLQPMVARRDGRVLNVASVAAFQPGPTMNVYYASKAFVYSFSYALAVELEATGVTVTALCPGTTRTEFFERGHIEMTRPWPVMDARTVAELGFRGMMKGKRVVITGHMNQLMARISPCLPARLTSGIVRRVHERRRK